MRDLLEAWLTREIMMDFEKEWNQRREDFLSRHPSAELKTQ